MVIISSMYKEMGFSVEDCKTNRELIVFENAESAQEFAALVQSDSITETTNGFLVSLLGSFATTIALGGMLLALKKTNPKLAYRLV